MQNSEPPSSLISRVMGTLFLLAFSILLPYLSIKELIALLSVNSDHHLIRVQPLLIPTIFAWPFCALAFWYALGELIVKFKQQIFERLIKKYAKTILLTFLVSLPVTYFFNSFYLTQIGFEQCKAYQGSPINPRQLWLSDSNFCLTGVSHLSYTLEQWMIEKQEAKQSITLEMLIAEKDRLQQAYEERHKQ